MKGIQKGVENIQRSVEDIHKGIIDFQRNIIDHQISKPLAALLLVPNVVTPMQIVYNSVALFLRPISSSPSSPFEISKLPLIYISMIIFSSIGAHFTQKWVKDKSSIVKLRLVVAQLSLLAISSLLSVFASNVYSLVVIKSVTGLAIGICNSSIREDVEKIQNVIGLRIWGLKIFTFVATATLVLSCLLSETLVMLLDVSLLKCDALVAFISLTGLVLVALRLSDLCSCSNEIDELIEDYTDKDHEQSLEEDKVQGKKVLGLLALCVTVHTFVFMNKS